MSNLHKINLYLIFQATGGAAEKSMLHSSFETYTPNPNIVQLLRKSLKKINKHCDKMIFLKDEIHTYILKERKEKGIVTLKCQKLKLFPLECQSQIILTYSWLYVDEKIIVFIFLNREDRRFKVVVQFFSLKMPIVNSTSLLKKN